MSMNAAGSDGMSVAGAAIVFFVVIVAGSLAFGGAFCFFVDPWTLTVSLPIVFESSFASFLCLSPVFPVVRV
jgi:hypothetical protein